MNALAPATSARNNVLEILPLWFLAAREPSRAGAYLYATETFLTIDRRPNSDQFTFFNLPSAYKFA